MVLGSFIVKYKRVIINMKNRKKLIIAKFREMVRQSRQVIDESIKLVDECVKCIYSLMNFMVKLALLVTLVHGMCQGVGWFDKPLPESRIIIMIK